MTDLDISHVLDDWVYEPGKAMVRKIIGKHDRELIQMRIDLGVLQMHAVGRPDGQRPHDMESLLDFHIEKLESHINEFDGDDSKYKLSEEECVALQQEAIQYHHRYICFFQLEAYEDVIHESHPHKPPAERNKCSDDGIEWLPVGVPHTPPHLICIWSRLHRIRLYAIRAFQCENPIKTPYREASVHRAAPRHAFGGLPDRYASGSILYHACQ